MKRIITLLALVGLCHLAVSAQKKYEMVVEKTDGTEVVIKTEDIVRTYFRVCSEEDSGNGENDEYTLDSRLFGTWYQQEGEYIIGFCFNSDGTGWKGEWKKGQQEEHNARTWKVQGNRLLIYNDDDLSDDFIYSINADEMILSLAETQDGRSRGDYVKQLGGGGSDTDTGGGGDTYITCPDTNHPHMIELGLPSGTK